MYTTFIYGNPETNTKNNRLYSAVSNLYFRDDAPMGEVSKAK